MERQGRILFAAAVSLISKKPQLVRSGYLKTPPADYVGERHVAIVKREPRGAPGTFEWCEFEEPWAVAEGRSGGRLHHDTYNLSRG
jgi:hypothetical protein